jgi:transposase
MNSKETTQLNRASIVALKQSGFNTVEIASRVGVNKSTVNRVFKRYLATTSLNNAKRSGRPKKLTPKKQRLVIRTLKKNPSITATGISKKLAEDEDLKISRHTISRTLNDHGYVARIKKKKPLLSKKNQALRYQWAKDHINWTLEDWKRVVWSDETKFNLLNSDGKEYYWTNNPGQISPASVKSTLKYGGGSIMLWSCMTWQGMGHSCKIDGNMDGELYCQIMKGELMDTMQYYQLDTTDVIFQHDNDPKHRCKLAVKTLRRLGLNVMIWPSQSPDMNPIEHLWDYIDRLLRKRKKHFSSRDSLWLELEVIIENKHTEFCQKLISTMPQRVRDLKAARGVIRGGD